MVTSDLPGDRPRAALVRGVLVAALLLGVVLRLYPQHRPEPNPELQQHFPKLAVLAVAEDRWDREYISHGLLLLDVLTIGYEAWYQLGLRTGRYADRVDVLADWVDDWRPFVVGAKILMAIASIATLVLVASLGRTLAGPLAGALATLVLAVSFVHVRETHHVWLDVVGGLGAVTTTILALRVLTAPAWRPVVVAGIVSGLAVAASHRGFVIALTPLVAIGLAPGIARRQRLRWMIGAGSASVVAFAAVSPMIFLDLTETIRQLEIERTVWGASEGQLGMSFGSISYYGLGIGACLLGAVGAVASLRRGWREAVVCLLFPATSVVLLVGAPYLFVRYLASLAPFVAVFAGLGALAIAERAGMRRAAIVAVCLTVAASAAPAWQSIGLVRLRALEDTRDAAGRWIDEHVDASVPLTFPNLLSYVNPAISPNAARIRLEFRASAPELLARGATTEARNRRIRYLRVFHSKAKTWAPTPGEYVVTGDHPLIMEAIHTEASTLQAIRAAGGREVARFVGLDDAATAGVVFDDRDAEYIPLTGFGAVTRPGPTLTIWRIPLGGTAP